MLIFLASQMTQCCQFNLHFLNRSVTDAEPSCYLFVGICFVHSNYIYQVVGHDYFAMLVPNHINNPT